jgi:hypothetical protein
MAKTFYYQKTHEMTAREGNKFATTYYKQTLEQRQQLTKHIRRCSKEILDYLDNHPEYIDWHKTVPLKGFPKTGGQKNRTTWEIIEDIVMEANGKKRDGMPKDYAMAPIERWNKLFRDTEYEFNMEQNNTVKKTTFDQLWETAE